MWLKFITFCIGCSIVKLPIGKNVLGSIELPLHLSLKAQEAGVPMSGQEKMDRSAWAEREQLTLPEIALFYFGVLKKIG